MDDRTKREKLRAMANQTESPHEAEIAQRLLDEMGPEPVQANTGMLFYGVFNKTVSFTVNFHWGGSGDPFSQYRTTSTGTSPKI